MKIPSFTVRWPLECWRRTSPTQAARWCPFLNSEPWPMAAMTAVAVLGPTPLIRAIYVSGGETLTMWIESGRVVLRPTIDPADLRAILDCLD